MAAPDAVDVRILQALVAEPRLTVSELAERAGMSKQAMNQLLQSLERLGYIRRDDGDDDGRARVVRFTERGHAAWDKILEILADIESDWRGTLGDQRFNQLKDLLQEVCVSDLVT